MILHETCPDPSPSVLGFPTNSTGAKILGDASVARGHQCRFLGRCAGGLGFTASAATGNLLARGSHPHPRKPCRSDTPGPVLVTENARRPALQASGMGGALSQDLTFRDFNLLKRVLCRHQKCPGEETAVVTRAGPPAEARVRCTQNGRREITAQLCSVCKKLNPGALRQII